MKHDVCFLHFICMATAENRVPKAPQVQFKLRGMRSTALRVLHKPINQDYVNIFESINP